MYKINQVMEIKHGEEYTNRWTSGKFENQIFQWNG